MSANLSARARAQLAAVEEHVSRENAHDLPGIMATFGQRAWYTAKNPGVNTIRCPEITIKGQH
jgi:hypothetical protein